MFIIGPSGKRFRSRNELKTFFEKTGETTLNPDDFDFSTFGRNNPKMPLSNQATLASSNPRRPPLSCFHQPPRPPLGGDQAGDGQWLPPINLDEFNDEQTFASQLESFLDDATGQLPYHDSAGILGGTNGGGPGGSVHSYDALGQDLFDTPCGFNVYGAPLCGISTTTSCLQPTFTRGAHAYIFSAS